MHRAMLSRFLLLMVSSILVAGCASTRSVMEWQDEAWSGKLDNILVIAAAEDNARRRSIEDAYVEEFAAQSVGATPGYTLISNTSELSREIVEAAIAGQNLDAVLVTHQSKPLPMIAPQASRRPFELRSVSSRLTPVA